MDQQFHSDFLLEGGELKNSHPAWPHLEAICRELNAAMPGCDAMHVHIRGHSSLLLFGIHRNPYKALCLAEGGNPSDLIQVLYSTPLPAN